MFMKAIVGRKMGMTEVFTEDGQIYAVTVVEVLPNVVTQVKTVEKDGYDAIQVGYEELKESAPGRATSEWSPFQGQARRIGRCGSRRPSRAVPEGSPSGVCYRCRRCSSPCSSWWPLQGLGLNRIRSSRGRRVRQACRGIAAVLRRTMLSEGRSPSRSPRAAIARRGSWRSRRTRRCRKRKIGRAHV